jgi:hypothetical protein
VPFSSGSTLSDAWFAKHSRYVIDAALVAHFGRSGEVLRCAKAMELGIISLGLNREYKKIIPREIRKCEEEKQEADKQTNKAVKKRKKDRKRKVRKSIQTETIT